MTIERGLRLIAGIVVLLSILLAWLHSPYWVGLTAFVGLNLFQSAFTNWCPMVWFWMRGHETMRRRAKIAAYCHRRWRTDNECKPSRKRSKPWMGKRREAESELQSSVYLLSQG